MREPTFEFIFERRPVQHTGEIRIQAPNRAAAERQAWEYLLTNRVHEPFYDQEEPDITIYSCSESGYYVEPAPEVLIF